MAKRAAAVNPAPVPLTSYKRHILHSIKQHGQLLEFKMRCAIRIFEKAYFCQEVCGPSCICWKDRSSKNTNCLNRQRNVQRIKYPV